MAEHSYDLVVVGAGSGNMLPDSVLAGRRVAVVEAGLFGGTCLNRGCIPSKILVYTADVAQTIRDAAAFGIDASLGKADWPAIRDRVFGHIDTVPGKAVDYRRRSGVDVYTGQARFTGPKELRVGEDTLRARNIVLATGSRPKIPDLPGLADVPYLTSDNVMRLPELPGSMAILGGGFIAAEMGHVFSSLGSKITVIERGPAMLSRHDTDISKAFTTAFGQQVDLRLNTTVQRVDATADGVRLSLLTPDGPAEVTAAKLLVATGRRPNSDLLNLPAAGIGTDEHGHVRTDDRLRTMVPGVWALGDLANHFQLKHMANAEARVVWHNIVHPDQPREARFPVVPAAVFSRPAGRRGRRHRAGTDRQRPPLPGRHPAVRQHCLRLGAAGHHQLRQGPGRPGDPAAARRAPDRPAGLDPDPAPGPGHVPGQHDRRRGNRRPLYPPGAHRGRRAGPPRPGRRGRHRHARPYQGRRGLMLAG